LLAIVADEHDTRVADRCAGERHCSGGAA
jgi:hypothetical protein